MNIFIRVKPKAREEKVVREDDNHFVVYTKEIPEKGKANEGVVRLLSKYFSLPKSKIVILSRITSRLKAIYIAV